MYPPHLFLHNVILVLRVALLPPIVLLAVVRVFVCLLNAFVCVFARSSLRSFVPLLIRYSFMTLFVFLFVPSLVRAFDHSFVPTLKTAQQLQYRVSPQKIIIQRVRVWEKFSETLELMK